MLIEFARNLKVEVAAISHTWTAGVCSLRFRGRRALQFRA
jgi:hypothetical protein